MLKFLGIFDANTLEKIERLKGKTKLVKTPKM